jgi:pimeloyl-ACP methyl ester carboxylesterase
LTPFVPTGDQHSVTYEVCGPSSGMPVFLLHGTPGSHRGPKPRTSVLVELGVRLISYDRPGYGNSTRRIGRSVASAAEDVQAIADAIGADKFCVVGRSGGGPHALACAALLPERVLSAAVLVGLAPADAKDLGWYEGMAQSNVREYQAAAQAATSDTEPALVTLEEQALRVKDDPSSLLESLGPDLTDHDRRVVEDVTIRRQLTDTYREALKCGACGWVDDAIALRKPWDFDPATIQQEVLLWHGEQDPFSPLGHAYWLAEQITNSVIEVATDTSHFGAVEILPHALAWVKSKASERLRIQQMRQSDPVAEFRDVRVLRTDYPPKFADGLGELAGSVGGTERFSGNQQVRAAP